MNKYHAGIMKSHSDTSKGYDYIGIAFPNRILFLSSKNFEAKLPNLKFSTDADGNEYSIDPLSMSESYNTRTDVDESICNENISHAKDMELSNIDTL